METYNRAMHEQSANVYAVEAIREIERRAMTVHELPDGGLMLLAARAAFERLSQHWPRARRLLIACGPGNNGGDGLVLARLAREAGLAPIALVARGRAPTRGDGLAALQSSRDAGVELREWDPGQPLPECELIVDALFGIGLDRAPQSPWSDLIDAINQSGLPVFALDLPSGLDADRGIAPGTCVSATRTLTFVALKPGVVSGGSLERCGEVELADLSIAAEAFSATVARARMLDDGGVKARLGPRSRGAHKGAFGHIHAIGGDSGMGGALRLCCEAALRCGAGRVTAWTRGLHVSALLAARPEVMVHAADDAGLIETAGASVLAIGPGLGRGEWARACCARIAGSALAVVADADALTAIAAGWLQPGRNWVLTPHPGEAARLLGCSTDAIQSDRWAAVLTLARRFDCTVVLKGQGSLIATPDQPIRVCPRGNPGMASAGMGDTLTGVIAALMAQGLSPFDAACTGVHLHAWAGDLAAAAGGERGLLAGDLFPFLRRLCNPVPMGTTE